MFQERNFCRPFHACLPATPFADDHKVFGGMSFCEEAAVAHALQVTVSHVLYPVTVEVLHQVFGQFGAEKVSLLEASAHAEGIVSFRSFEDAVRAREACNGRCIWDGCCVMDVSHVQSTIASSATSMPAAFSTLGLVVSTDTSNGMHLLGTSMYMGIPAQVEPLEASSPWLPSKVMVNTMAPITGSVLDRDPRISMQPITIPAVFSTYDASTMTPAAFVVPRTTKVSSFCTAAIPCARGAGCKVMSPFDDEKLSSYEIMVTDDVSMLLLHIHPFREKIESGLPLFYQLCKIKWVAARFSNTENLIKIIQWSIQFSTNVLQNVQKVNQLKLFAPKLSDDIYLLPFQFRQVFDRGKCRKDENVSTVIEKGPFRITQVQWSSTCCIMKPWDFSMLAQQVQKLTDIQMLIALGGLLKCRGFLCVVEMQRVSMFLTPWPPPKYILLNCNIRFNIMAHKSCNLIFFQMVISVTREIKQWIEQSKYSNRSSSIKFGCSISVTTFSWRTSNWNPWLLYVLNCQIVLLPIINWLNHKLLPMSVMTDQFTKGMVAFQFPSQAVPRSCRNYRSGVFFVSGILLMAAEILSQRYDISKLKSNKWKMEQADSSNCRTIMDTVQCSVCSDSFELVQQSGWCNQSVELLDEFWEDHGEGFCCDSDSIGDPLSKGLIL